MQRVKNNTKRDNLCKRETFPGEEAHHSSCFPLFGQVLFNNQWLFFFFFCRYHVLFEMVVFVSVVIKTNQETLHNPFITNSTKSLSGCCSSAFAHALAINEYRSSPITPDLSSQHWNTLPSSTNLLCIRTFVFYSWGRWITPNFLYVCTYHLVSLSLAIQTLATVA